MNPPEENLVNPTFVHSRTFSTRFVTFDHSLGVWLQNLHAIIKPFYIFEIHKKWMFFSFFLLFFSFCMAKIDGPLIYTTKRYLHKYMKRHFLARLFKCNNKNLPSTLKFEVHTNKKELLFLFCMAQNRQRLFNLN